MNSCGSDILLPYPNQGKEDLATTLRVEFLGVDFISVGNSSVIFLVLEFVDLVEHIKDTHIYHRHFLDGWEGVES